MGAPGVVSAFVSRGLPALAALAFAGIAGLFGLSLARAHVERDVYRDRLRALASDYETLRDTYNTAVRQTSVTELIVEDGELSVAVRDATGGERTVDTPYDPSNEIYVDYAVVGGRVFIRRVFDGATPPVNGVVINPELAAIDWDDANNELGKAVYRSLGEGRWVIGVAGNGGLGLRRVLPDEIVTLAPPPEVGSFAEIEEEADEARQTVGWQDVLDAVLGGGGSKPVSPTATHDQDEN